MIFKSLQLARMFFFERNTHCRKALENSLSTALYRYDEIQGLPRISQITNRKKTSSMYITPPVGYKLLSIFFESISSGMFSLLIMSPTIKRFEMSID